MKTELRNIERVYNISIIHACESGSRAWGFASPDSDYDVRFIYTHSLDWYLSTQNRKDSINILDGDFDAVGWELRKSVQLLQKSNVPALEHLFSPILYMGENTVLKELQSIATACFSPVAAMYHYLSMSKKYEEKLLGPTVKLKSLFYALRTALAGKWILEFQTMPPVVFEKMLLLVPKKVAEEIRVLMKIKSDQNESYLHLVVPIVTAYISEVLQENEKYAKTLPSGKPDLERIDALLYKEIIA